VLIDAVNPGLTTNDPIVLLTLIIQLSAITATSDPVGTNPRLQFMGELNKLPETALNTFAFNPVIIGIYYCYGFVRVKPFKLTLPDVAPDPVEKVPRTETFPCRVFRPFKKVRFL
jgi:hypothetical protein